MDIRQLEYFIAVSEELHFTKAAERLGVTQPTLSLQIKALEEELRVTLFDRIGKKIALTEAGALFLEHSAQIVRDLQNAKDSINDLREYRRGSLTVGALPSDLDYRIADLLIDYHAAYPNIKLKIVTSIEIANQVLGNEVDIGIGMMPVYDDRLVAVPLRREEYVVVVSERHPLADLESIELERLRHIPTVMYPLGYIGREQVEVECRRRGFTLQTIMETSSATSLIRLVKANVAATVQPGPLIETMNDPALRCIRIADGAPSREIGIIYRVDRYLGHAARAFIDKTIRHFKRP
ncbi:LysR family transcriptional regulator [Paenibacillus flagellatus]|uniref:LysR family transcriptional regulator n=1 Tax=Paenibacillus flagellatus TaxID=2211139 RepID=A0A2V5JYQ4_9BACL|nr:LysR family transcriptional regulator [Paenibacillus flagellatus]PYI51871.1 LysR family transcriptional regulator [Paenibacillus flagellatus]